MSASMRAGLSKAWGRVPRLIRRGAVIVAAVNVYGYAQSTDVLYKVSNPGRHAVGGTVLDLDLGELSVVANDAARSNGPLSSREQIALPRMVATLRAAREDPRVAGLVVRGLDGLGGVGGAELMELRDALRAFSRGVAGKPAILHLPSGISSTGGMWLCSAFDAVHVQPTSPVIIPGISLGSFFFRGTLDKLGVTAEKVARKEYKTAMNSFTEKEFTDAHKESTEGLADTYMDLFVNEIAEGRGLTTDAVRAAIHEGLMTTEDAYKRGLIDLPAYRDELPVLLRARLRDAAALRSVLRKEADAEWRGAFENLADVWQAENSREFAKWAGGSHIHSADSLEDALRLAVSFFDPSADEGRATKVIAAELRALKAHLKWLETRPWEGIPRGDRVNHGLLIGIGHVGSILELETRLCSESIAALEGYPSDLAKVLQLAKENEPVPIADVKNVIRWTRALWRAKTLAGRMASSVTSAADPKTVTDGDEKEEAKTEIGPCAPRVFLTHQVGDPVIPLFDFDSTGEVKSASEKLESARTVEEKKDALVPAAADVVDYCAMWKNRGTFKDRLRYTRFGEYVDLRSSESRVAQRRASRTRMRGPSPYESTLKGMPPGQFVGGVVNRNERNALAHLADYGTPFGQPWRMHPAQASPTIAVITVDGAISDATADETRSAIRRATKDARIHGIVLRIDSPGGSATASDLISRAVEVSTKPVIASMSNVCASGGVYIASPCDKIFAQPTTITGSIGVIMSSFLPTGLFESLGISTDKVDRGRFSKYFGSTGLAQEWDAEFRDRLESLIDDMYKSFVSVASRGRGMDFDAVEKLARGRVWSGVDAKRLGLIDDFGGLQEAVACAAEMAGGEPGSMPRAVTYPSMSMMLESRLRRAGAVKSHIDEEGDEEVPTHRKRRRQSPWKMISISDDLDEDDSDASDDEDEDDADVSEMDEEKASVSSGRSDGDIPVSEIFSEKKTSSSSGGVAVLRLSMGTLEDLQDGLFSTCALFALRRLDDYLMSPNPSDTVVCAIEFAVRGLLRKTRLGQSLEAEMNAAAAAGSQPAALMSPQVHALGGVGVTSSGESQYGFSASGK